MHRLGMGAQPSELKNQVCDRCTDGHCPEVQEAVVAEVLDALTGSALPPRTDITEHPTDVRQVPGAEIGVLGSEAMSPGRL